MNMTIFGYPIFKGDVKTAAELIFNLMNENSHHRVVSLNPEIIVSASADLEKWLQTASLILPDGMGLVYAIYLILGISCQRITGIDVVQCLFSTYPVRAYCLGSSSESMEKAVFSLKKQYPRLDILGYHHGYLTQSSQKQCIADILSLRPNLVLVGMGFPRQEQFIQALSYHYEAGVSLGVGGAFDVWSGSVKRAPAWMQAAGLEWVYRYLKEPKRFKRILFLPRFLIKVFKALW